MGFDLLLIATNANGLTVPSGAKCCVCHFLLDDGVGLSGCHHNSCFQCMKKTSSVDSKCPVDGHPFDMRKYYHLSEEIESWLSNMKLKCQYFDGQTCTATAIAIRNAHRHREICPNNPKNKLSREQINVVKLVHNWMKNNDFEKALHSIDDDMMYRNSGSNSGVDPQEPNSAPIEGNRRFKPANTDGPKPKYGFKPTKRSIGRRFFSNEKSPESDSDWRK